MGWLIFWVITIAYGVVGYKRMLVYVERFDANNKKRWPSIYDREESLRESIVFAFMAALVWPFADAWTLLSDQVFNRLTAEERKKAEFEKAEKIVAGYLKEKEQKRRKELDEFDRKLRD